MFSIQISIKSSKFLRKRRVDGIVGRAGLHSQQPPRGETWTLSIILYTIANCIIVYDRIMNCIVNNIMS